MGAGVGEHLQQGFFKSIPFVAVGRGELRRFRTGIHGHILPDGVGQINDGHGVRLLIRCFPYHTTKIKK